MRLFEDEFMDIQSDIIGMCLDFVDGKVDKVYGYGLIKEKQTMFNVFYTVDNKTKWTHEFRRERKEIFQLLKEATACLNEIRKLCKQHERQLPNELRMVYNNQTGKYESSYKYGEIETEEFSVDDIFDQWKEEVENELEQKKG